MMQCGVAVIGFLPTSEFISWELLHSACWTKETILDSISLRPVPYTVLFYCFKSKWERKELTTRNWNNRVHNDGGSRNKTSPYWSGGACYVPNPIRTSEKSMERISAKHTANTNGTRWTPNWCFCSPRRAIEDLFEGFHCGWRERWSDTAPGPLVL